MNSKIKQFIAFGVCSVVALALCLGILVITVNNFDSEISETISKQVVSKTELNSSKETLVTYINDIVSDTSGRFVKTKTYTDVSVNDINVLRSAENKENDVSLLNFAKDRMLPVIDNYYAEDFEGTFEKDDSIKLALILNKNSLKNAVFSIGQVDENGESILDDEGNLLDEEYYYLTYEVDIENKSFNKKISEMFSVNADISAKEKFINTVKDDCLINDFDANPENFIIKAKVNRANDEIQYINVIRRYAVKLDAEFINAVKLFGEKEISFIYTITDVYEYSYAGVSFVEDEVDIDQNEEYMLNVSAIIDDDSEYTVEFSSSDENIVSVDEMGYIKALKKCDVPVEITVKLNYLGETFTDTCIVNVCAE